MLARRITLPAFRRLRRGCASAGASLLALMVMGTATAAAPQPFVPTPAELFGPLFVQVQMDALFPDGKLFPDAVPKASPLLIMQRYRAADRLSHAALLQFVRSQFSLPTAAHTPPARADKSLEAHIARLWPLLTRQPAVPPPYSSLLYVPKPYVVPGGRFREFYYWDSYFSMLGLIPDGHLATARDLVDDFSYMLREYGHIPNGARTYYLSRSQPPVYFLMVGLLSPDASSAWAQHLADLEREYAYWMEGSSSLHPGESQRNVVKMPDGSILNRYWDASDSPRDESYRNDVLIARASGKPPAQVYRDIRAAAESGWDFSSRWLRDGRHLSTIDTTDIVPVDLNSLLYGLEEAIASGCSVQHDSACERSFTERARRRKRAMDHYLWDAQAGYFMDYDWRHHRRKPELTAATLYPLFTGVADNHQADALAGITRARLLKEGGIVTTNIASGQQWDAPNGWPPLQWIAVAGLRRYHHGALAHEIARRWLATVERVFVHESKLVEKYDVEHALPGGGGEYPLQDGFGWTNGVTRALIALYPDLKPSPNQEGSAAKRTMFADDARRLGLGRATGSRARDPRVN
ncbi:MAG TPA: alpha,alpha-trehalase TreF [Steroidobacteraceae bacterium]|nr:alpha,alpha-trehalase TreF [Steroidobacteraceae bacterium]